MNEREAYAVTDQDLADFAGRLFLGLLAGIAAVIVAVRRVRGRA
jgi:hypothetical protein